ncbi:hypothetical protein HN954_03570 [bacterium]|jgi:acetate kinase|nr:hypothetical protein [bacterium]MBT6996482.1 hypothetical protein [bacterium]MBT7772500.1 hypothetical protein [bacterium]
MKNILIVNPGSTAIKYTLFDEKGTEISREKFEVSKKSAEKKFLKNLPPIEKIGIRIVHGSGLVGPQKLDRKVKKSIADAEIFAPIHNRIALETLEKLKKQFPKTQVFAVFDSDFHQHFLPELKTLPLPEKLAKKFKLRRYGFHGIAIESAWNAIEKPRGKIIFCHLGGGSSITAVRNGKSIWNSMGLTPLSGAMGKTRTGSIDPDIFHVLSKKMSVEKISNLLSNKSGFLGLAKSTDTKKIMKKASDGKSREKFVVEIFVQSVLKEIFTAFGILQGTDLLVFSGGIGENNKFLRGEILKKTKILGLTKSKTQIAKIDEAKIIWEKIRKL